MTKGLVYTLRKKRHTGKAIAVRGRLYEHDNLARVNVELVKLSPDIADLAKYLKFSGFDSVDDWLDAAMAHYAKYTITSLMELGLYKVTLLEYMREKK
jgi:hypothetical protein